VSAFTVFSAKSPRTAQVGVTPGLTLETNFENGSSAETSPKTELLRQILEGQKRAEEMHAEMYGQMRAEIKSLKRRVQQLQSDLDKRPYIDPTQEGWYYHLKVDVDRPEGVSGIRAAIYKLAGEHGAYQHLQIPILYTKQDLRSMVMNLYFNAASDANEFMNYLHSFGFYVQ
jgi:hypothetical protein